VLAVFGLLVLMGSPAAAQILPSSTTTSEAPTTTTSSTTTTLQLTTTTLAGTTTTAAGSPTTAKRSTATKKATSTSSTSTTELKSTNTFVPPRGRRGAGTTTPALPFVDTPRPGDRYLGLFVVLSVGGFGLAALIIGSQLVATRPIPAAPRKAATGKGAGTRPAPSSQSKFFDAELEEPDDADA
jgi:hypothetical protein